MLKTKIFIPLIAANFLIGLWAVYELLVQGGGLGWLGAAVATLPFPLFIFVLISNLFLIARTPAKLHWMQLLTNAGLVLAFVGMIIEVRNDSWPLGFAAYLPLCLAWFGELTVFWYLRVYSSYGRKPSSAITRGEPLPELTLQTLEGTAVSSAQFLGHQTLMVFFRGNWCPLCMAQLKEVVAIADRLERLGVRVKFISNQSPAKSRKLAAQLSLPPHFEILYDAGLAAAKALEIQDIGGTPVGLLGYPADTVMATVIALDEQGRVLFGDQTDNYRVRPHPDSFMGVFEG